LRDDDRLPTVLRGAALDVTVRDQGGLVVLECSTTRAMPASA
jgi:hypothetical protein